MSLRSFIHSDTRLSWRQRIYRHIFLAIGSGILAGGFFFAMPMKRAMLRLSLATAYVGLAFLGGSLLTGPWNVLRGGANPLSTDLRRDLGIWAGLFGLVHTVIGLQMHLGGNFWLYFFYPADQPHFFPLRSDPFGFANFTGLGATLVLILLLALSNDVSLRTLGALRWKALQRWNYACFVLVFFHSVVYQVLEKRHRSLVVLFSVIVLITGGLQLAGFRKRRRQKPSFPQETQAAI